MKEEQTQTQPTSNISLEDAMKIVSEMKAANAERLALIEREERLKVESLLGGSSEANIKVDEPSEDEKVRARVNQMLSGTGLSI